MGKWVNLKIIFYLRVSLSFRGVTRNIWCVIRKIFLINYIIFSYVEISRETSLKEFNTNFI